MFVTAEPLKIEGQNPFDNSFGKDLFGKSVPATVRICASLCYHTTKAVFSPE